jgi:hypothetical protein
MFFCLCNTFLKKFYAYLSPSNCRL